MWLASMLYVVLISSSKTVFSFLPEIQEDYASNTGFTYCRFYSSDRAWLQWPLAECYKVSLTKWRKELQCGGCPTLTWACNFSICVSFYQTSIRHILSQNSTPSTERVGMWDSAKLINELDMAIMNTTYFCFSLSYSWADWDKISLMALAMLLTHTWWLDKFSALAVMLTCNDFFCSVPPPGS